MQNFLPGDGEYFHSKIFDQRANNPARVFWINLPLCIPPFVGLIYTLNLRRESSSFAEKLARIDYLGMAMFCGATCAFLIGITTGGTINPWSSAQVIAPIVVGVVLWIAFVIIEWKYAKEPMIHLRIFNDRTAASSLLSVFIHGLVIWTYSYYMIIFVCLYPSPTSGRTNTALSSFSGHYNMVVSVQHLKLFPERLIQLQQQSLLASSRRNCCDSA